MYIPLVEAYLYEIIYWARNSVYCVKGSSQIDVLNEIDDLIKL